MWYAISSVMVLVGIVSVVFKGIEYGIDFRGGTELVIGFSSKVPVSDVRLALDKVGLGKSEINSFGLGENDLLIRTAEQGEGTTISDKIKHTLQQSFPNVKFEVLKEDRIGPKIGKETPAQCPVCSVVLVHRYTYLYRVPV